VIKSNNPHLAGGEIGIKKQIGLKKNKQGSKKTKRERKEGRGSNKGRKEGRNPSGGCC
jgi:hypothetical protein